MRHFISQPGAVLAVTGEDHQDFLHGQGTADLHGPAGFCRYSLWLDFKGNILADSFVLKLGGSHMLLLSDCSPAEFLMQKFDRHIIADDVSIENQTADFELISIPADAVDAAVQSLGWMVPATGEFLKSGDCLVFSGRRLGANTLQVLAPVGTFSLPDSTLLTPQQAEILRLQAAVPLIPVDADQATVNPVEAAILSPVSFTKGCYLGQEVVARAHRLGRASRRLVRLSSDAGTVQQGDFLHLEGKQVGKFTSVVNNCDNIVAIGWLKSKIIDGMVAFDEGVFTVDSIPAS